MVYGKFILHTCPPVRRKVHKSTCRNCTSDTKPRKNFSSLRFETRPEIQICVTGIAQNRPLKAIMVLIPTYAQTGRNKRYKQIVCDNRAKCKVEIAFSLNNIWKISKYHLSLQTSKAKQRNARSDLMQEGRPVMLS